MYAELPNLELLEYQALEIIESDDIAMDKIRDHYKSFQCVRHNPPIRLECEMFMQTWGSTNTGFDVCPDGSAAFGGQAMTEAYTTVFWEKISDTYIVFIDNKHCYTVYDPSIDFSVDLKNRRLLSYSKAKGVY